MHGTTIKIMRYELADIRMKRPSTLFEQALEIFLIRNTAFANSDFDKLLG